MRRGLVWGVLALAACGGQGVRTGAVPEGGFVWRLDGIPTPLRGKASYARCAEEVHVFLVTDDAPKASVVVHPMGAPLRDRHPVLSPAAISRHRSRHPADTLPGPLYVAVVLPPDSAFDADSGVVEVIQSPDGHLRGSVTAWLRTRRVHTAFIARRDPSLEAGLRDGDRCAH